jgi:hypothetical protein
VVLLVTRLEVPSDTETSCARPYSLVRRGDCRRPEDEAAGRRDQTRGNSSWLSVNHGTGSTGSERRGNEAIG